jgi:hypothetical protein
MEQVTTTAMVATVVGYLAKKVKDNKSVQDFFSDFTDASVNWLRPIFLQDDKPKDIIEDLQKDPNDRLNSNAIENAIAKVLKKEPALEEQIKILYDKIVSSGSNLALKGLTTKTGVIEIKVEQKDSTANIQDIEAGTNIKIDIKQE